MKSKVTFTPEELHYLQLLAKQYPTVQAASTEIINLQSILNLPKGTEHFISDIHGEYEAFLHILNSCSGYIKEKIDELFAQINVTLDDETQKELIHELINYITENVIYLPLTYSANFVAYNPDLEVSVHPMSVSPYYVRWTK